MTNDEMNQIACAMVHDACEAGPGSASEEDVRRHSIDVAYAVGKTYSRPVTVSFDEYSNPTFSFVERTS